MVYLLSGFEYTNLLQITKVGTYTQYNQANYNGVIYSNLVT